MKFARPHLNVIQSDEGFTVEVLGRTGIVYTEGKRQLLVDSEVLVGPSGMVIYASSIEVWNPPFDSQEIDEEEKNRIVENIRKAFRFDGFEIEIS